MRQEASDQGLQHSRDYVRFEFLQRIEQTRKFTFVNCWYEDSDESLRMWREYTNLSLGLAVKTDCRSLIGSINTSTRFHFGRVKYTNRITDLLNPIHYYTRFLRKELKFQFEQEARVISMGSYYDDSNASNFDWNTIPDAIEFNIDPLKLIHELVITPYASYRFIEQVDSLASIHGLEDRVKMSSFTHDAFT